MDSDTGFVCQFSLGPPGIPEPENQAARLVLPKWTQTEPAHLRFLVPLHSDFDRWTVPRIQFGRGGAVEQDGDAPRNARLA